MKLKVALSLQNFLIISNNFYKLQEFFVDYIWNQSPNVIKFNINITLPVDARFSFNNTINIKTLWNVSFQFSITCTNLNDWFSKFNIECKQSSKWCEVPSNDDLRSPFCWVIHYDTSFNWLKVLYILKGTHQIDIQLSIIDEDRKVN